MSGKRKVAENEFEVDRLRSIGGHLFQIKSNVGDEIEAKRSSGAKKEKLSDGLRMRPFK